MCKKNRENKGMKVKILRWSRRTRKRWQIIGVTKSWWRMRIMNKILLGRHSLKIGYNKTMLNRLN